MRMLNKAPRLQNALKIAAEKSGWGTPLPPGVGRGVGVQPAFASWIATVAEVEVNSDGEVKLRRVVCVVDTGIAVNPNTIKAQLQGGLIFGLTAALHGEITIDKGRVQQSNFNDYRMLRINETPPIEIHVIPSGEARVGSARRERPPPPPRSPMRYSRRQASAYAAFGRSRSPGGKETSMSWRRIILIAVAVIVVGGAGIFGWIVFGPGPMVSPAAVRWRCRTIKARRRPASRPISCRAIR